MSLKPIIILKILSCPTYNHKTIKSTSNIGVFSYHKSSTNQLNLMLVKVMKTSVANLRRHTSVLL